MSAFDPNRTLVPWAQRPPNERASAAVKGRHGKSVGRLKANQVPPEHSSHRPSRGVRDGRLCSQSTQHIRDGQAKDKQSDQNEGEGECKGPNSPYERRPGCVQVGGEEALVGPVLNTSRKRGQECRCEHSRNEQQRLLNLAVGPRLNVDSHGQTLS